MPIQARIQLVLDIDIKVPLTRVEKISKEDGIIVIRAWRI
jgi:hypothetical protein